MGLPSGLARRPAERARRLEVVGEEPAAAVGDAAVRHRDVVVRGEPRARGRPAAGSASSRRPPPRCRRSPAAPASHRSSHRSPRPRPPRSRAPNPAPSIATSRATTTFSGNVPVASWTVVHEPSRSAAPTVGWLGDGTPQSAAAADCAAQRGGSRRRAGRDHRGAGGQRGPSPASGAGALGGGALGARGSAVSHAVQALFGGLAPGLGIEIRPRSAFRLLLLDRDPMRFGPGVVADAGHLPGDLGAAAPPRIRKRLPSTFARDPERRPAAERRELVAEVAVERLEPVRQLDPRLAAARRASTLPL